MNIPKIYFKLSKKFKDGGTLKEELDQFGNLLETEISDIFTTEKQLTRESKNILENYLEADDEIYSSNSSNLNQYSLGSNYIPSKAICFATDGTGNPFCMDFLNGEMPRIIFWDDGNLEWRIIADSIENFFNLFDPD